MSQKELNLGILAHVDAGKTTLTERLLYAAGVIDEVGSVDAGTTQTDFLALERRRGITIRSAVASFAVGDVHVNLIDTPGHPDFIAEVERVLSVLDGAVLVVSAVEGVQPQTRILMRALQRLRLPTLFFVNKIDRAGADDERAVAMIRERLNAAVAPMRSSQDVAEALAEHDLGILEAVVEARIRIPGERLRSALAVRTREALLHPLFVGSALTGAGVEALMDGIAELLPAATGDPEGPVSAAVFKIERGPQGEKIAYVRVFSGTIRSRDRLRFDDEREDKVTAVAVFESGSAVQRPAVAVGRIAKLWGLAQAQVGDRIGAGAVAGPRHRFRPPTLESVVGAVDPGDRTALRVALTQLAEQDPLIDVRQDDLDELSVSLYGEVQKEVLEATLAEDYGIEVAFRDTTPIYIERPLGFGEAVEVLHTESNPFLATIGLRVEPARSGSGLAFRLAVESRTIPLYIYKTAEGFTEHMEQYVRDALGEGIFGWQVTDCTVTMTRCTYAIPDGPPSRRGRSTATDFRKLTPVVLRQALDRAGTAVCEPVVRARLEIPAATIGAVVGALGRLGVPLEEDPALRGDLAVLTANLPVARAQNLERELPRLTGGEGIVESEFVGYEPVIGPPPTRQARVSVARPR